MSGQHDARPQGPDVTADVMRRLGISRVSPLEARRRRRRRALFRLALCLVALAAAIGLVSLERLARTTPESWVPTIPSAVEHDLRLHGRTIDRVLGAFRDLSPGGRGALPSPADETVPSPRGEPVVSPAAS